jgi:hypothetical protein
VQLEIATRALKAMNLFTADGGRLANLFIDAEGDVVRIAASNRETLALLRIQDGHGEEPLLRSLSLETGKTHEEMIFPAGFVLPGIKERECEYLRIDQSSPSSPIRVTLENGVCVTPPFHLHDEKFLRYEELIEKINIERLKETTHLAVDPRNVKLVMDAAKKLGIENAHQIVMAPIQTDGTGEPGPLGMQVVNVNWFWVASTQLDLSAIYTSMAMPPSWAFGDNISEPLPVASTVQVKEGGIITEQLALAFDGSDPCTDPDPLLKVMTPGEEAIEMHISEMLSCADIEHYLKQLAVFHLKAAWRLNNTDEITNDAGLIVGEMITDEYRRRKLDMTDTATPEEPSDETPTPTYRREECPACAALENGVCAHGDNNCVLDEQQVIESELTESGTDSDQFTRDPQGLFVTMTYPDMTAYACHGFGSLQAALDFTHEQGGHLWQVMNGQVEVWTQAGEDSWCWSLADADFSALLRASRKTINA